MEKTTKGYPLKLWRDISWRLFLWRMDMRERRKARARREAERDAARRIQIQERWGNLYLCVDGHPLMGAAHNGELLGQLAEAREIWARDAAERNGYNQKDERI